MARDSYGNLTDRAGTVYQTPDNKPAQSGVQVQIPASGTTTTGTMVGGYVVPNK